MNANTPLPSNSSPPSSAPQSSGVLAGVRRFSSSTRRVLFGALSVLVFAFALVAVHRLLGEVSWREVEAELATLSGISIMLAILAACCSYALLTTYDWVAVRASGKSGKLGKAVPLFHIFGVAFLANALGHNLGMAALTGGSVRVRGYAEYGLGALDIAQIIANASLGFLLGALFWLGCLLSFEPSYVAQTLPLSLTALHAVGALVLALLCAGLMLLTKGKSTFTLFKQELRRPKWREVLPMLIASILELACAAGVLYNLLPAEVSISFVAFIGLYVFAITTGLISAIPGGLGVFEATLLLLLPSAPPHKLLAAILAYRAIYYFLPLLLALLVIATHSLRRHSVYLSGRIVWASRWTDPLIAPAFALLVFALGAALVLNGSLPLNLSAKNAMVRYIALPVLELSHLGASALGVALILLANGIYQRIRVAWWMCLWGLTIAALLVVLSSQRVPLIIAIALLMLLLWSARRRFYRGTSLLATSNGTVWWRNALLVIAAAAWLGIVVHQNVAYRNELWWQFAFESDAPRMLRAVLVCILALGTFGFARLLWPRAAKPIVASDEQRTAALGIIVHAAHVDANLALLPDKQLLFADNNAGLLMYQRSGPCLVAMGDPIGTGQAQQQLAWRLREIADRDGLHAVFYQISAQNLPIYLDMGMSLSKLGEEAVVPLADFSLDGPKRAGLRQEHRRAVREGAQFAVLTPDAARLAMPQLKAISDAWLEAKSAAEKGFSIGYFDESYLARFPCAVVKHGGQIVAFANVWSTAEHGQLSVDLMRYVECGVKSVMDFLFIELMLWGRANGYRSFCLGMAPLTGLSSHELAPMWHKLGGFASRHGGHFYNFAGLRNYKNKFSPEWYPRYLACSRGIRAPLALFHISRLIAGGTLKMFAH